jgi:hypothetical protein
MSGRKELTRAELVHLRRTMENARRIEQAAREATRPIPPVSARARREIVRSKHRSAGSARRRFLSALHLPRVDVHSIHIPRPRFGWRLLSFLRVAQAQVTGNRLLDPAEVNAVLNVTGDPIFTLIPSDLETRLRLNYPEIVSVKVTISLPNLVFVDIVERQPIIRWEQAGAYTWIAEDGIAFRPRGEASGLITVNALSAPPVEGGVSADPLSPAPFISVEMVKALQRLVSRVPPGAPILYESNMGFGWDDPRGWRVHFGTSASEMELKMRVYEAMVDSLTQRGIRPALINVMYPTAPYYRMDQ